jgi:uroporphyrinogen decarboxylase
LDTTQSRFELACRRRSVDRTPIWIMRQAGRYLPEYRELRSRHSMLELCRTPRLACEVTLQPLRRFDLDAAILFSDLLIPIEGLGLAFDIVEGRGPVIDSPIGEPESVASLPAQAEMARLDYVPESIERIVSELAGRVPVIGFAGAPFTLASYLIEGHGTRDFRRTKSFMYRHPEAWDDLLRKLSDLIVAYAGIQVRAGVVAIQIFDSWIGSLGPSDYRRYALDPTRRVFEGIAGLGVPAIHFGTMTSGLIDLMAEAGGEVLGVDWRVPLSDIRARFPGHAVQGNLDPVSLFAPPPVLERMIDEVIAGAGEEPGHIFNLGHGILPETPIDNVRFLVERVHEMTRL